MRRRPLLLALALGLPLVVIAGVAVAVTATGGGGETERQRRLDPQPASTFPDATSAVAAGFRLELERAEVAAGRPGEVSFRLVRQDGSPVGKLDVWQDRELHAFLIRKDLGVFARIDVKRDGDERWTGTVDGLEPGPYRLVVDVTVEKKEIALGVDVEVPGTYAAKPAPAPDAPADAGGGRQILVGHRTIYARENTAVSFTLADEQGALELEPYLDGRGFAAFVHEDTLAYVHGHPRFGGTDFATVFAAPGRWRAFFEYRAGDALAVAITTIEVNPAS